MTHQAKDAQASMQADASLSAALRVQHSFTRQHFRAAEFFAESAAALERDILAADGDDEIGKSRHRAFVSGAVVSAVMGLESCINEIYLDARDKSTKLAELDESEMDLLALWWPEIESRPILLKYQHALLLLDRPCFSKGDNPYQDADHLIHLRNALTHYKPEWDDSLDRHANVESRLTGRFELNPLSTKNAQWFPDQCLGSGCAKWAVSTSEGLVSVFCAKLGIAKRA